MALQFADCILDLARHEVRRNGEPVAIEPQALRILVELISHRDRVVTKTEVLDAVWGDRFVSESALTTQIKALRRALGDTGREQRIVKTVHGQGYMFVAPVTDLDESVAIDSERANPVVAVLPFHNFSPDPAYAHVADGLTHDLVAALSKYRWLRVQARAISDRYRDAPGAIEKLRTEHGVHYVVEGSVQRGADRLRVTVSLTDAIDGTC